MLFLVAGAFSRAYGEEGGLKLRVEEHIQVYKSHSSHSQVIRVLKSGDSVEINKKSSRGWRRVLYFYDGKPQSGYIRNRDIDLSYIEKVHDTYEIRRPSYMTRTGFGLAGVYSQFVQPPFSQTLSEVNYEFSEFLSQNVDAEIHFDFNVNPHWAFRLGLMSRHNTYRGTAQQTNLNTDKVTTKRDQQLFGGKGDFKYYFGYRGSIYGGFGAELSKTTRLKLTYGSDPLQADSKDSPVLVIVTLGLGADIHLYSNFFLNIEASYGNEVNGSPNQKVLQGLLALNYVFAK